MDFIVWEEDHWFSSRTKQVLFYLGRFIFVIFCLLFIIVSVSVALGHLGEKYADDSYIPSEPVTTGGSSNGTVIK